MAPTTESPWIWMKGSGVTLNEPSPLPEGDDRPSVQELIAKHRAPIDALRDALQTDALYVSAKHDDLWLLRFLLSHKMKHKAALKAAKYTLNFRAEHKLDDTDIRQFPIDAEGSAKCEGLRRYISYCCEDSLIFTLPDPKRGVVAFLHFDGAHDQRLVDNVSKDDWLEGFIYAAEWSHQWLDYVTRTTGRLTKSVRLIEVSQASLIVNREKNKRDGDAMNLMEDCYPQMLQTIFACNPPKFVQIVWRIVRVILPRRVVEKIDILSPAKSEKERQRILKWIDEDKLPAKFGGKNTQWPPKFPLPKV